MTSSSGAAYNEALEYLRPHGTLVAVGLPPDTYIKANVFWTVFKALRITGSYVPPPPLIPSSSMLTMMRM